MLTIAGRTSVLVLGGVIFAGLISCTAWAQTAAPIEPSIDGCGKAQAALHAFRDEEMVTSPVAAVMEPMDATDVLHYDLDIEVSNINVGANSCTIAGTCKITIQSKSASLVKFTFRLRNQFNITSALINDVTPISVTSTSTTTREAFLDRVYAMDETFTLTIAYSGTTFSAGFGSIEVRSHSTGSVVASLSEPYYAYTWWPAKDGDVSLPGDNSDKSTMDFSVTVPNTHVVPANGVLQSVDTLSGNRKRYNWSTAYPIATYLVSFATTNYNTWTQNYVHAGGSMPVQFYIYPQNDTPSNRAGWEKAIDMMAAFAPLYGEYPFVNEKYGLYNFPFSGGMEHQTITGQSGFNESLTAHELGHQWWGDNVTCETWSDIWLNEGFATYSEALWEEHKTGSPNLAAYLAAMQARKPTITSGTVYIPANETSSVSRIFDSNLSYRKGAWVLHQLRKVVGDSTFFQILADYRAAFQGGAATTDEFAASASATAGQDLGYFFDQWVKQPGAPTYQYGWDSVTVDGQEYLHVRIRQTQNSPFPSIFTMPVDLRATIAGSPQTLNVFNNRRTQWFVLPVSGPPTALQFDPDQWILRSSATSVALRLGDLDGDNDVDNADYTSFTSSCYTGPIGPTPTNCDAVDFEGDNDVDCSDFEQFQLAWTAGGEPPVLEACLPPPVPAASSWGLVVLALAVLTAGTISLRRAGSGRCRIA